MIYNVSGKSIKDLMSMPYSEFIHLDRQGLANVTTRLVSAANKRIKRNEKTFGKMAKFSVKDKNLNELRREYSRVKKFLSKKRPTKKEMKRWQKKAKERLKEVAGIKLTDKQMDKVFKAYEKLKKYDESLESIKSYKYRVIEELSKFNSELSDEDIDQFAANLDSIYESLGDSDDAFSDLSSFFE